MSRKDPYAKFMERSVGEVQDDLALLDLVKGLEAYSAIVSESLRLGFPEYPDEPEVLDPPVDPEHRLSEEARARVEERLTNERHEPLDDLHHFARECREYARGVRQQLEQRMFGKRN